MFYCEKLPESVSKNGQVYSWGDERSEVRLDISSLTTGAIILKPEEYGQARITLVDVSKNGIGAVCPIEVEEGQIVELNLCAKDTVVRAEVRFCRKAEFGFRVGLKVLDNDKFFDHYRNRLMGFATYCV